MKTIWKQMRTARRCFCLLFAALFIVSAAMTGTLALQADDELINDFYGTHTDTPPPPPPSTINISVEKVWSGDTTDVRPASVQAQLYRNGTALGQPVTLDSSNSWKHTWRSLSQSGTYTVEEVAVPTGYTAAVTRSGNTFTITNTYTSAATDSVTVSKVWSGEAPHPESVTISLYKNGIEHAAIVLNAENNWTHTWTELDRTATWTVGEKVVPDGYEASIATISAGVFVVTNTKDETPPPPPDGNTVIVSGQKFWRHGSNAQSARPTSVTIYIHENGTVVKEISVTGPNWTYSTVMPKYDGVGNEITYTVSEKPISGYTSVVSGWNITNVHTSSGGSGPKTGDDSMMLLWFALMLVSAVGVRVMLSNVRFRRRKGA